MCGTCGCNEMEQGEIIKIEQDVLAKNQEYAEQNRDYFAKNNILAFNFLSSPGAGKTTLLVKTIQALRHECNIAVLEGDQQTDHDARRIAQTKASVIQINTGKVCHLDAQAIQRASASLDLAKRSLLFIENVGNLICPTLFDLGEKYRVVILSVTEGEDKPLKYPYIFQTADLLLLTKIDLLPHIEFDIEKCIANAKKIKPDLQIFQLSATKDRGLAA